MVFSKAGRDKTKTFVIVGIIDKEYVIIANGGLRKINQPKRKKLKHLQLTNDILEEIKLKLIANAKIFYTDIRKALEVSQRNL